MEEKIKDAIGQIRPFLQRDGGDIEFVELTEDNIVKVKLQGHCAGCPGAQMTIKGDRKSESSKRATRRSKV